MVNLEFDMVGKYIARQFQLQIQGTRIFRGEFIDEVKTLLIFKSACPLSPSSYPFTINGNIPELYNELKQYLIHPYEILWIDDGSKDDSLKQISALAAGTVP